MARPGGRLRPRNLAPQKIACHPEQSEWTSRLLLFLACHPEQSERTSRLLLFLTCHPEQSERTPRLLSAPSTTTPSANINPAQQDDGKSHSLA
jgi:hypothetical protein